MTLLQLADQLHHPAGLTLCWHRTSPSRRSSPPDCIAWRAPHGCSASHARLPAASSASQMGAALCANEDMFSMPLP